MFAGYILMRFSRWRAAPSLLRPLLNSDIVTAGLRVPTIVPRSYGYATHLERVITPSRLVSIARQISFLKISRWHWKRWATVGTLSAGVLGGVAISVSDRTTPYSPLCKSLAQDDTAYQVHVADQSTYCNTTFSQFTLREKIYAIFRCIYLSCLFTPTLIMYGVSRLLGSAQMERMAWSYTMRAAQIAGPAFIKLGQWASTRRDLFNEEFCNSLSQLHTACRAHRWQDTLQTLEEEFGKDWRDILEITSGEPIGSGCVAQVYKGTLKTRTTASPSEGEEERVRRDVNERQNSWSVPQLLKSWLSKSGTVEQKEEEKEERERETPVAIKVLHPGTVQAMERDMLLMRYAAYWMDWLNPDFHWVALKECFSEFSIVMRKQLDMELEAHNLRRFQQIMGDYENIKFPTPLFPYVTKRVLVETFEPGVHISSYMDNPGGQLQKTLARIGTSALLDMLFIHNFVHGDLHPGNILVQDTPQPRLVLLDCGIATSLTHFDLLQMRALFTAIVKGDGVQVADLMLGSQPCPTVEEYRRNMADLVSRGLQGLTRIQNVKVSNLFSELFDVLMKHKVRIEPNYTSVVMAIMVIEGLGRSLDPSLNLLEAVTPCLLHRARRHLSNKIVAS